jgi:aryl-alcohol dehydrogenase-like predicted oxidoreductase
MLKDFWRKIMNYRTFPKNKELSVSEVGFGVWSVATKWWGVTEEKLSLSLLHHAFDVGINFYDTADIYGNGYGEEVLAKAFPKSRDKRIYATKFGYDIYSNAGERKGHSEMPQKFSAKDVRFSCEQSLKRLSTDYIDIYQLHNPRMDFINNDEVLETLEKLVEEGKIRSYAMALGPDIGWLDEGLDSMNHSPLALQIIYNLLEQEPSKSLFDKAAETETGLISRVPHASGIMDGSFTKDKVYSKDDHRSHRKQKWMQEGLEARDDFEFLYKDNERTIGQAAILFPLSVPSICTVLPNFTSHDEIDEYSGVSELSPLSSEEISKIENLWVEKHSASLNQPFSNTKTKPTPS